jgi:hypothetical protein
MFGYVRPHAPDLRLREYEYYRGVYCGLCRAMGRCTGQCSRLALSYDLVFLALTRLALAGGNPTQDKPTHPVRFEKKRCLPHPLRPRASLEQGDVTDYTACAAAVLGYHKLLDDKEDEKGPKKWRARLLLPWARRQCKRAERRFVGLSDTVTPGMTLLSNLESSGLPSLDEPAAAFGQVLGALFACGLDDSAARVAHHIGYHIGRWLYMIDAADDYEDDLRAHRPNPLTRLYQETGLPDDLREQLENAMIIELSHARDALDLIAIDENSCGRELSPLLYHILEEALPMKTHAVLFPVA